MEPPNITPTPRDPNAPKLNLSAYLLYMKAMRDEFSAQNPDFTAGQLSKYASSMYKELSPEEKYSWHVKAEADKERYANEMAQYNPPEGYYANGVKINEEEFRRADAPPDRDPNEPKMARSSFILFVNDYRPQIMAANPEMMFHELSNVLGVKWRNLSAKERKRYDALAEEDKMRFETEMEVYMTQKAQRREEA